VQAVVDVLEQKKTGKELALFCTKVSMQNNLQTVMLVKAICTEIWHNPQQSLHKQASHPALLALHGLWEQYITTSETLRSAAGLEHVEHAMQFSLQSCMWKLVT